MPLLVTTTIATPRVVLFLLAFLLPLRLFAAADTPTKLLAVEDLVAIVLKNNAGLAAAKRNLDIAAAGITTAGARPNPRVESVTGSNRALQPAGLGGSLSGLAFSQFLENPRLRSARVQGAEHQLSATEHVFALNTHELTAQVRIKAFEHLLRKEEERGALEALNLLEQIRLRVKVRVESGEAARYEIIKADAEVIQARQKFQTASLQVEQSALALNRLASGQLPANWQLTTLLSDPIEVPSLAQTLTTALANNPELKMLEAEKRKRQAKLTEAKLSRWPGLEIRYAQQRDVEIRQNALSASIQIPLFDQRDGPIAEATADFSRTLLQLDGKRIDLEQHINVAWKSLQIARIRVNALSTGAVTEAQAALRVAEAAYRFGERGILDVLDAQRVLRSVLADLLDARYQYQIAHIDLQFLAGIGTTR